MQRHKVPVSLWIIIKAMLGMLGGGENISENLSGCLFTLGISLHKEIRGGGDRTYLSQRREASSRCTSQYTECSSSGVCEIQLSGI